MAIELGTLIAKHYRVLRPLGKGGMGEVFAAENTRTMRKVALKVLRAEAKAKASAIERFRREARAAGSINSDYVTEVLDVEDDPEHGIVLVFELLEGESLVERLKRTGPIPYTELWGMVEAVWMGLADAHAAGIIHRDLKPSNVFLVQRAASSQTRVKILDFGISKLPKKITTQSLTQVGQSLGTFSFMPPEQIGRAKTVDHRADIYACATLIYQALSGQLPYQAKNVVAMMELKSKREPRTLAEAMGGPVDPRLEHFIAKGLAREPDQRFLTALEALEEWRRLRPAGAISMTELESSGVHPAFDPSTGAGHDVASDSVSTARIVLHTELPEVDATGQPVTEDVDPADVMPETRRVGSTSQPGAIAPHAAHPTPPSGTPANVAGAADPQLAASHGQGPYSPPPNPAPSPSAPQGQPNPSHPHSMQAQSGLGQSGPYLSVPQATQSSSPSGSHWPAPAPGSDRETLRQGAAPSQARTYFLLVLGAIALMAVGFGVVALVLQLLQPG